MTHLQPISAIPDAAIELASSTHSGRFAFIDSNAMPHSGYWPLASGQARRGET
jgi:hypothetical protein